MQSRRPARPFLISATRNHSAPRTRRALGTVSSLTAAVLTALYGAPPSMATTTAAAATSAPSEDSALQEVVVTASRRAVSAQDLPISITAVSGEALAAAGIQDMAGLAHSMAGVNFTDKGPFDGVN